MKRPLSIIILFFSINFISFAGENLRSNLDIIDSLADLTSREIISEIKAQGLKEIDLTVNEHNASELYFKSLFKEKDITYNIKTESNGKGLNLNIIRSNVSYEIYPESNDSLCRVIKTEVSAFIKDENGKVTNIKTTNREYRDKISREDVKLIESYQFDFTHAEVPERESTFFEDIAQPLIVITGALLTIVLLFTVRSS